MDNRPVGMFDSGVGGLSVFRAFRDITPEEDVVYLADTAWFPYGPRPAAEVRKRSFALTRRLLESNVKLIVVACNTASAAAISDLRKAFPVPFVGMVPGVKPAALRSRSGRVVILATEGTFDGELYARVVDEFARGTTVTAVTGTGLAALVEAGQAGTARARETLERLLGPQVKAGADTVVLGCTHYHFLAADIAALFPGVEIVDTSEAASRRAAQLLEEADARAEPGRSGVLNLIVTGDRDAFEAAMQRLGFEHTVMEATR